MTSKCMEDFVKHVQLVYLNETPTSQFAEIKSMVLKIFQ